jgi:integrase
MKQKQVLVCESEQFIYTELDNIHNVIPFKEGMRLFKALKAFKKRPEPDNKALAVLWLLETGARPSEIEKRSIKELQFSRYWVWSPRKNQKGHRTAPISDFFLQELDTYLKKGKYSTSDIFGIKGESLARYINKHIRPILRGDWLKKYPKMDKYGQMRWVYLYQLKNLRHNYQTFRWFKHVPEFGPDLALMKVSKEMRHTSKHITGEHYIEHARALGLEPEHRVMSIHEVYQKADQVTLNLWGV